MNFFPFLFTVVLIAEAGAISFEAWVVRHKKSYTDSAEEAHRRQVFNDNAARLTALHVTHKTAHFSNDGPFADLTAEEFQRRALSKITLSEHKANVALLQGTTLPPAPQAIDWRDKGAVTDVKNQEKCGACWAFTAAAALESSWFIKTGKLVDLSMQQLISCDTADLGCSGGSPESAYVSLINGVRGLEYLADYPFVMSQGGKAPRCTVNTSELAAYIEAYSSIGKSESSMAQAVASLGPLSVVVDATSWQQYSGGIFSNCPSTQVNHAVTLVGYGVDGSVPYWVIKNSWSAQWGEAGYMRLARGSDECLITTDPTWPKAGSGNPGPLPTPTPAPPTESPSNFPISVEMPDLHQWLHNYFVGLQSYMPTADRQDIFGPLEIVFGAAFVPFGLKLRKAFYALGGIAIGFMLGLILFVACLGESSLSDLEPTKRTTAVVVSSLLGTLFMILFVKVPMAAVRTCSAVSIFTAVSALLYWKTRGNAFAALFAVVGVIVLAVGSRLGGAHPAIATILLSTVVGVAALSDGISNVVNGYDISTWLWNAGGTMRVLVGGVSLGVLIVGGAIQYVTFRRIENEKKLRDTFTIRTPYEHQVGQGYGTLQDSAEAAWTAQGAWEPASTGTRSVEAGTSSPNFPPPHDSGGDCVICFAEKRTHVATPCGHLCLCEACCRAVTDAKCPLCRVKVDRWVKVFDS